MPDTARPQPFSRMDRSFLGMWWWTVDRMMMVSILVAMVIGIGLVATASTSVAQTIGAGDYYFLRKHLVFIVPSVFALIGLSMLSPRYVWRVASLLLLASCVLCVMALFFGIEVKGARRWISMLGFSIQPGEFLKPAYIVVAAWLIALQKQKTDMIVKNKLAVMRKPFLNGFSIAIFLYALMVFLLLMQPDLGMTVVVTLVFGVQMFLAGLRFRYLAVLIGLGGAGIGLAYLSFYHVRSRVDRFFNPESGDNYQVERSLDAIKNGGVIGVGPGQGVEKIKIPDAHADFIFSVLAEEMGFVFSMIVMGLFLFILLRGFRRLKETQDLFSMLAAGGLLAMFGFQSLIHIGSSVNLLPTKGMTLPFMSYGGSSLLSMSIAMGMVLALTRQKKRTSIARGSVTMRRASAQEGV